MKTTNKDWLFFSLAGVSLFIAALVDDYLPINVIVTSLYCVPILIIAYRFSTTILRVTSLVVIITYILESYKEHTNGETVIFALLGMLIVTFLAIQFNRQWILAVRKANEVETAKNQLQVYISMVSHDLFQPIQSALLYTQLLSKNTKSTEKNTNILAADILAALKQSQRLINDLRDAMYISSGQFSLQLQKVDLVKLIKRIIKEQKIISNSHYIKLDSPKRIVGKWDEERLNQLFTNLLSNAIKYSPRNKNIVVLLNIENNSVVATIKDHGIGMTEKQIELLFNPFTRFHLKKAKGMGLGLYISKGIVEAQGGQIWVESEKNKGSTFFVKLPLDPS